MTGTIQRIIVRLELFLAWLYTLVPDAYCDGCDPPEFHGWAIPLIAQLEALLRHLYALLGL
jgi:hypothetical protein